MGDNWSPQGDLPEERRKFNFERAAEAKRKADEAQRKSNSGGC
jgi:hypothetical protein